MGKNTIDLKALLESKMGSFEPSEDAKTVIETAEKKIPHNLMFDAESTVFKPETRPTTLSGAKQKAVEDAVLFNAEMDRFIQEALVPGVDFGVIPGCGKPCLLKSGAEKIALYLNLIFRVEVVGRTEDFQQGLTLYSLGGTYVLMYRYDETVLVFVRNALVMIKVYWKRKINTRQIIIKTGHILQKT